MPRQARIVAPNTPHHVTQRGNYQQSTFDNDNDYKKYCQWINEYAQENNVDILAYCLMANHVHFVVEPSKETSLSKLFNNTHMRYSQYLNKKRGLKGHLWQGRFYSCILDDAHLYRAIRYVENNPVRARIVNKAWDYDWSSASDHTEGRAKPLVKLKAARGIDNWEEYLQENDPGTEEEIRIKTKRGLVVGTDKFIKKLEKQFKRSLQCLNQGRPKKGR